MARKLLLSGLRTVLNIETIYSFLSKVDQLLIFNIPQKTLKLLAFILNLKINNFKKNNHNITFILFLSKAGSAPEHSSNFSCAPPKEINCPPLH